MRKLLIADSNEDFRLALAESLQQRYQILCCGDGMDALRILRTEQCDVFVLDLMLPELDGLTLLEQLAAEGIRPMVLATTPLLNDYVFESAERLGIGYVMRKPCQVQAAAQRVCDLSRSLKPVAPAQDPRSYVSELLLSFRISTKHNGFDYLKEAVLLMAEEPGQPVTKVLYPAVAKICGCEKGHVERSIRTALDAAWSHRDAELWRKFFPDPEHRPSNTVFITRLAEHLRSRSEA